MMICQTVTNLIIRLKIRWKRRKITFKTPKITKTGPMMRVRTSRIQADRNKKKTSKKFKSRTTSTFLIVKTALEFPQMKLSNLKEMCLKWIKNDNEFK